MTPGLLDEELFQTIVKRSEGLINSRPLTYVTGDCDDLQALTPSDFFCGTSLNGLSPMLDIDPTFRSRWLFLNRVLRDVWQRYMDEYVPQLRFLNKQTKQGREVEVGDVVASLADTKEGSWPLARVLEVFRSKKDGRVRSCKLKFGNSTQLMDRHVRYLMVLVPNSGPKVSEDILSGN